MSEAIRSASIRAAEIRSTVTGLDNDLHTLRFCPEGVDEQVRGNLYLRAERAWIQLGLLMKQLEELK
jgi:hypothetical protein